MKATTLKNKTTGKYLHFHYDEFDDAIMVERNLPEILMPDITLESLLDHYAMAFPTLDTSEFEVVELDVIESGVVGADIRNKLTPIKNLLSVVSIYFLEKSESKKLLMKGMIEKEIKQARISLEYLTKLL